MSIRWRAIPLVTLAVLVAGTLFAAPGAPEPRATQFPHDKHATVFPLCSSCHAGVTEPQQPVFPEAATCVSCHDGVVKKVVEYQPRTGPRPGNRRFTHDAHNRAVVAKSPADSGLVRTCSACHTEAGAQRMSVRNAVIGQCLDCHKLTAPHVDNPGAACAQCHVRLTDAPLLSREDIAGFPLPRSHREEHFLLGGHGKEATVPGSPAGSLAISASCATCHARNLCLGCHVNPPESRVILALAFDDRAAGAQVTRTPPSSHTREWRERHATEANARPTSCETCHTRSTCLECHRPSGARQVTNHPPGFVTRHPSAAFSRTANCADCHNPAQFCQSCHQKAGLVTESRLGQRGYHDAFRGFSLGHGQAARQNLESCASCHTERNCTACHSAVGGGFRFNPHGPGFDAARMKSKNPSTCIACHGRVP